MAQAPPFRLLRRDALIGNSYLHILVAIDAVFLVGFLVISGLCLRILVSGRGRRLPYAWLLASSMFYAVFLALDLTANDTSPNKTNTEAINLSNAIMVFHEFGFFTLFFAIASVLLNRRKLAFELAGRAGSPASVSDILVVLVGVAIYAWLVTSCIVVASMNVWSNALILRIDDSPFGTVSDSEANEDLMRQLQTLNASYVVAGAQCAVCIYMTFAVLYSYTKAKKWAFGRDEALKWMAYLLPPLCFAYIFCDLWFTITTSPSVHLKVYNSVDDVQRANIAVAVIKPAIPFLMSLILVALGLKQSWWNRTYDDSDEFVKLHDLKSKRELDAKSTDM